MEKRPMGSGGFIMYEFKEILSFYLKGALF